MAMISACESWRTRPRACEILLWGRHFIPVLEVFLLVEKEAEEWMDEFVPESHAF